MPDLETRSAQEKARKINLDGQRLGTFAEIGAGQEVARCFFHVGKASATVAKSISAYDMAISDAVYGPTGHYVSRTRLESMQDHEYGQLIERLGATRSDGKRLFVFADTAATHSSRCLEPATDGSAYDSRRKRARSRRRSSSTSRCSIASRSTNRKPSGWWE